jgi:nuclear pore complex protein Nup62
VKAPSEIVGKNVEEIITSWNAELVRNGGSRSRSQGLRRRVALQERQTRAFGTHARALAEWDRHIFRNRRTLGALEAEIKRVAGAQDALERQLSILEVHQSQIHDALEDMEREAMDLYEKEPRRHDEVSRERHALFAMAEDVSKELVDIGAALRETIQLVRALRFAVPSERAAHSRTAAPRR